MRFGLDPSDLKEANEWRNVLDSARRGHSLRRRISDAAWQALGVAIMLAAAAVFWKAAVVFGGR
jgi:hypothetical protein